MTLVAAILDPGSHNVTLVNAMQTFRTKDQTGLFLDHVHPTAAGHVLLAEDLARTIEASPEYAASCRK